MTDDATTHRITESADKITLKTALKRGTATRDEDKIKCKVKGDDPADVAATMADLVDALDDEGLAATLRATDAEGES